MMGKSTVTKPEKGKHLEPVFRKPKPAPKKRVVKSKAEKQYTLKEIVEEVRKVLGPSSAEDVGEAMEEKHKSEVAQVLPKQKQPDDLITLLVDAYCKHRKVEDAAFLSDTRVTWQTTMEDFTGFAQAWLRERPPTGVYMAMRGVGLRLTDGTQIPVVSFPDEAEEGQIFTGITKGLENKDTVPQGKVNGPTINVFGATR